MSAPKIPQQTPAADEQGVLSSVPPAANPALSSYHDEKSPPPYSRLLKYGADTEAKLTYTEAFRVEGPIMSRFHEVWASILFAAVVVGFVVITVFAFKTHPNPSGIFRNDPAEALFLILGNFGIILCLLPLILLFIVKFPGPFIRISFMLLIGSCLANIVISLIIFLLPSSWSLQRRDILPTLIFYGCFNLLLAIVLVIWFLRWASKIPFSVLMLRASSDVVRKYKKVFMVSLLGGLATMGVTLWYMVIFVLLRSEYESMGGVWGVWGLLIYISFAYCWITQVLKNVIHVTISGVYAGWFFRPHELPSKTTRSAFGRAMTYSFGSISFGSLGVPIITIIQCLCSRFMFFDCIARLLRGTISIFNEYAYSYLAVFNTSYCSAAKKTFCIMKDRAIILIVNDCLVNNALGSGAFFIGSICCFYTILLTACGVVKVDASGTLVMLIPFWTLFVSFQCCSVALSPIGSGVTTIFVGMALEPEVMKEQHPELYGSMVKFYPHLEKAVV